MASPADARLRGSSFDALPRWDAVDLSAVWPAWQAAARAIVTEEPALRGAQPPDANLLSLSQVVAGMPAHLTAAELRPFVERHLEPCEVPEPGFLTGYYEPVLDGSLVRTPVFSAPVLPRPADLVDLPGDAPPPGWPAGLAAAARRPDGNFEAYPDRARLDALVPTFLSKAHGFKG